MKMVLSKGKLPRLTYVEHSLCQGYMFDKSKRVNFSKVRRKPKAKKLELVHTNVWGLSPITSLGGSSYFVTFIDDSSRKA